ncbi:hypothetical protein PsYK624_044090 [Phanerochaete sordida]|uniref:Uncharacterized protein n=1 Tax=Phanerochaete sordida TaxID=48140 RepID=A0A9P3G4V4_9APHY|nr:hypothetical protein PsYK624_044090 [Phanerochaete sordida]
MTVSWITMHPGNELWVMRVRLTERLWYSPGTPEDFEDVIVGADGDQATDCPSRRTAPATSCGARAQACCSSSARPLRSTSPPHAPRCPTSTRACARCSSGATAHTSSCSTPASSRT